MATVSEVLAVAFHHHQAGHLQIAEQIYRQILAVEPQQADVLHLLGVAAHQAGKHHVAIEYIARAIELKATEPAFHNNLGIAFKESLQFVEAEACYRRALALKPDYAEAHNNLGTALKAQGQLDQAIASYRRALELKPDFAGAEYNLANAFQEQEKLDEAIACYRRALNRKGDFAEAHYNLGVVLKDRGKLDEAIACYRRALQLKPDFAEAHNNLSIALKAQGLFDEAIACCRRAVELKPDYAEAHNNLGVAFKEQGKLDEAAACYRRTLALKPDFVEAHNNLGVALKEQGKIDAAIACYRRAVELAPQFAEAHNNLGNAFKELGQLDAAIASCCQAIALKPDYAEAHVNLAIARLLTGDWQRGWPEYQWRWRSRQMVPRPFPQPLWDGASLAGKTILLHAEQGLGDTIQFVRYAPLVQQRGATVIVECQKPLLPLLAACPGIDRLVGYGDDLPPFDLQSPLLSLPEIFRTSLDDVPTAVPYLRASPALSEAWRKTLAEVPGYKIGINWQGRAGRGPWQARNIPLRHFAGLAKIPGVRLIALQKGAAREELAEVRQQFAVIDLGDDVDRSAGAFIDTAAIMMNLDLVVTSDTAVPHLAGALGVPVWVALPFVPDWRWMLDRCDSPWYPTMRLFRQKERGNWHGVFDQIEQALRERLAAKERN